jgi:hypothetical protein
VEFGIIDAEDVAKGETEKMGRWANRKMGSWEVRKVAIG